MALSREELAPYLKALEMADGMVLEVNGVKTKFSCYKEKADFITEWETDEPCTFGYEDVYAAIWEMCGLIKKD